MTQLNFNLDMDQLTEEILGSDLNSVTKGLAVAVFNAYMEAERDEFVQAKNRERSEDRQDMRNGYYQRDYKLPVGRITLKVPRTRSGEFSTELFERYQRMDQSLVLTLMESVISGVSTRKVTKIVETLCGESVSKSFVSSVMERLDPEIEAFQNRALHAQDYEFLYVDAMYIKVRENHRIVSKAVYIAQAVTTEHYREIVGFMISGEESFESWQTFFQDLRYRGMNDPKMVISDAHEGLKKAVKFEFKDASWQRCTFHFLQNIVKTLPKKGSEEARRLLKRIFRAESMMMAEQYRDEFFEYAEGHTKYEDAVKKLDAGFHDATQFLTEAKKYHISLRTSNSLERVNKEVRRREKVINIFPNLEAAVRLIGAVLIDINEDFQSPRRKLFQKND